jgi:hypothetical protein
MNETSKRTPGPDDISLIVRSDWSIGPRTAAWDRLWRRILGGIRAQATTDVRERGEAPADG